MPLDLILSKIISLCVLPLGLCSCLAIGALIMARWRWKTGAGLMVVSLGLLWAFSMPAFSSFLLESLESQYPPVPIDQSPHADAIVVLGGAVGMTDAPGIEADLRNTTDRVFHAARLYRSGKAPVVIAVTGPVACEEPLKSEAGAMIWLLREWGVPERDIISMTGSYNTAWDGAKTKQALDAGKYKRVLLVTSASHMRRALAVFQGAGIDAVPSATDYEVWICRKLPPHSLPLFEYLPDAESLANSTKAVKEYVGYLFYALRGWI